MSSIRNERVALDTNIYVHALRRTLGFENAGELFFGHITKLAVFVPLQVYVELQRNLSPPELTELYDAIQGVEIIEWSFVPAAPEFVMKFENSGAKKGDSVIAAQLHAVGVNWLISENRHFLAEISDLSFKVLSAAEALEMLDG